MIPTYHCAAYLRRTLESVLVQVPGPEAMQIEVVDDCSTRDAPQQVVDEIGRGRVCFFRQARNVGLVCNFNTCATRAQGRLVHILHGDDLVDAGFYRQVEALGRKHPSAALLATRSYVIDEEERELTWSERVPALERPTRDAQCLYYDDPLRTPGVVIRRDFYEAHGGFHPGLSHAADWEMWARAIAFGGGVMLNRPLARYRDFGANDTSRLQRTAENLRDYLRFAEIMASRHADFDMDRFRLGIRQAAIVQAARFRARDDREAYDANQRLVGELADVPTPAAWRLKQWVASIPRLGPAAVRLKEKWINARR